LRAIAIDLINAGGAKMFNFMPIKEIRKLAEEYNVKLLASDPRFQRAVTLFHIDGSVVHYDGAFLLQKDGYIICFTEHHGMHIDHQDELLKYWQVEQKRLPIEELLNATI
jgi:hypothetical protein